MSCRSNSAAPVNVTTGMSTVLALLRQQPAAPGLLAVGLNVFQSDGQQSEVQVGRLSK
jgi:hypothetical protein